MCLLDSTKLSSASITWSLLLVLLKFVWHSSFAFCTEMALKAKFANIRLWEETFIAANTKSFFFLIVNLAVRWIKIYYNSKQQFLVTALELTLNPSIRKPIVVVELSVSLHCMYLVFSTACWARSWTVGASGSTATIFSYISLRGWGRSRAISNSSSRYVLWRTVSKDKKTKKCLHKSGLLSSLLCCWVQLK